MTEGQRGMGRSKGGGKVWYSGFKWVMFLYVANLIQLHFNSTWKCYYWFFCCCCLGLFCFILFLFLFCVSSVWWFSLRLRTWVSVRMSCFFWRVFTLCLISDTTLRRWPSYQSQFHRRQTHGRSSGRTHWSEKALLYTKRVLWSPRVDNHHTQFQKVCVILHYSGKNFIWCAWVCMSVFCVY